MLEDAFPSVSLPVGAFSICSFLGSGVALLAISNASSADHCTCLVMGALCWRSPCHSVNNANDWGEWDEGWCVGAMGVPQQSRKERAKVQS